MLCTGTKTRNAQNSSKFTHKVTTYNWGEFARQVPDSNSSILKITMSRSDQDA